MLRKRLLAWALVLWMVVGMLPNELPHVHAEGVDPVLALGDNTVTLEAGHPTEFTFTPENSGVYRFSVPFGAGLSVRDQADSSADPLLAKALGDGGSSADALLTAGTSYVLAVTSDHDGDAVLTVTCPTLSEGDNTVTLSLYNSMELYDVYEYNSDYYFIPAAGGTYVFESVGNSVPDASLKRYDDNTQLAYDDDSGDELNFRIEQELEAGVLYVLHIEDKNNDTLTVNVTPPAIVMPALQLGDNDVTVSPDGSSYYSFTPAETGCYLFRSACSDDLDPVAELYEGKTSIAWDDDSGEGLNFLIKTDLTAGVKYSLNIWFYSDPDEAVPAVVTVSFHNTHTLQHVDAMAPTCVEPGNLEYWKCDECGSCFLDAEGTQEADYAEDIELYSLGHSRGDEPKDVGDGQHGYFCTRCGEFMTYDDETGEWIEPEFHTFDNDGVCTVCGAVKRVVATIGAEEYTSLRQALQASVNGDTIVIVADIDAPEVNASEDLNKALTLDLNGHTVHYGYIGRLENFTFTDTGDPRGSIECGIYNVSDNNEPYTLCFDGVIATIDGEVSRDQWMANNLTVQGGSEVTVTGNAFWGNDSFVLTIADDGSQIHVKDARFNSYDPETLAEQLERYVRPGWTVELAEGGDIEPEEPIEEDGGLVVRDETGAIQTDYILKVWNTYTVTVTNGTADPERTEEGTTVTVTLTEPDTGWHFVGWQSEDVELTQEQQTAESFTFTMPAADVTIEAVLEKDKYEITFSDWNGETLWTTEVPYGERFTYGGQTPARDEDEQNTYAFAGWDNGGDDVYGLNDTLPGPTGPVTYTATYTSTVREYDITFLDWDGTELLTAAFPYGENPVYTATSMPEREPDAQFTYSFTGWTDGESDYPADAVLPEVTGPAAYTAVYESFVNYYVITFKDWDDKTLQSGRVPYGEMPVYEGDEPVRPDDEQYRYTFIGWSPEIDTVTGEAVYTAQYSTEEILYTITFYDETGAQIDQQLLPYGEDVVYQGEHELEKQDGLYVDYVFMGWAEGGKTMQELPPVAGDASYTAVYNLYCSVTVRVVDSVTGDPLEGVSVDLNRTRWQTDGNDVTVREVYLDAEAALTVVSVPAGYLNPGQAAFTVHANSLELGADWLEESNGVLLVKLTPSKVGFRVLDDESGAPISGVTVTLENGVSFITGTEDHYVYALPFEDGRLYRVTLTSGAEEYVDPDFIAFFLEENGTITDFEGCELDGDVVVIRLAPTVVKIQVVDAETGDPLSGVEMELLGPGGGIWTTDGEILTVYRLRKNEGYFLEPTDDEYYSMPEVDFAISDGGEVSCDFLDNDGVIVVPVTRVKHTVTFIIDQETPPLEVRIPHGDPLTYPGALPEKKPDDDNHYTFIGWTDVGENFFENDALPDVTEDHNYFATFDAEPHDWRLDTDKGENGWTWAQDYSAATAHLICDDCGLTLDVTDDEPERSEKTYDETTEKVSFTCAAAVTKGEKEFTDERKVETDPIERYFYYYIVGDETYTERPSSVPETINCHYRVDWWSDPEVTTEITLENGEYYRDITSVETLNYVVQRFLVRKHAAVDPTCTEPGNLEYWQCLQCGKVYTDADALNEVKLEAVQLDALGHDLGEWTVTIPADCTNDGEEERTCSRCDYYETRHIGPLGHTPGDPVRENETPATCEAEGSYDEVVYCTACKAELSRETKTIDKLAHTPGDPVRENETPATCEAEGSYDEVVYCTVCKAELSRETKTIDKLAHTPGDPVRENETPATCEAEGSYDEVVYCTVCKAELSRETKTIDKLAHTPGDPVRENETPATCEAEGSYDEVVYCTVCETELSRETKTVDKLAHTPGDPVRENETPATCEAEGSYDEVVYCTVCKAELSRETKTVDKLAHTPGDPVKENETPATCEAEGSYDEVVYCTVCKAELSRETKTIDKLAHTPGDPVKENEVPATCEAEGSYDEVVYCTVCKAELSRETKTIDKLAHTPGDPVKENEVPATCEAEGSYDEVVYCTACEAELSRETKTVDKLAHTPGDPVKENETPATCEAEGSYDEVVYCTACETELSRETKTVDKLAHTPGDPVRENEVPATCEAEGSYDEVVYCTVCKAELSRETKTSPATGHVWANPVWAWTGDDETGYTAAEVTLTCENDMTHTITLPAELTVDETPAGHETDGRRVYTATATLEEKTYTDDKTIKLPSLGFTASIDDRTAQSDTPAEIDGIAAGGVYRPGDTFTVLSTHPCVVAVSCDGGETYTELVAEPNEDEDALYTFTLPALEDDFILGVIFLGDARSDGEVQPNDALRLLRWLANQGDETPYETNCEMDALAQLAADCNRDGKVSANDATRLQRWLANQSGVAVYPTNSDLEWKLH